LDELPTPASSHFGFVNRDTSPNDETIEGDTLAFLRINSPKRFFTRADSDLDAREKKGHREGHEGDDSRDLKGALIPGRSGRRGPTTGDQ